MGLDIEIGLEGQIKGEKRERNPNIGRGGWRWILNCFRVLLGRVTARTVSPLCLHPSHESL